MSVDPANVRQGMEVVGEDGERVGKVKEVRDEDFLIDRPGQSDVYAPFTAIHLISDYSPSHPIDPKVVLKIRASQVDDMEWSHP